MVNKGYVRNVTPDQSSLPHSIRLSLKQLDLELTERCNNNCIHCNINLPVNDKKAKRSELSTREIQRIIKDAHQMGCHTIRFTGGEPLLRKDFEEIYRFTRKLGLTVLLFTNATLVTPRLIELFKRIPPAKTIEVSLYGMKKTSYETVSRIPGSFEAAWRGVRLLRENQVPFVVKSVLLPANKSELNKFLAWAKTIPWMIGRPQITMLFNLGTRRDSKARNQLIKSLRPAPEEAIKYFTRFPKEYRETMRQFLAQSAQPPGKDLFSCGAGSTICSVDAYGYWQPCILVRDPEITRNLKNQSLKEAMVDFLLNHRNQEAENPEYLRRCGICFLRGSLCEQCPGKAWIEHGSIQKPVDFLCGMAQIQARFLGLLKKDELPWEVRDGSMRIQHFISQKE